MNRVREFSQLGESPVSDIEIMKSILKFANYCPSTHNTQPWKFKIRDNLLSIHKDTSKQLTFADPQGRDFYLSVGALLENIEVFCREFRIDFEIQEIFKGDKMIEYSFNFSKFSYDPNNQLFLATLRRQNFRGIFNGLKIPDKTMIRIKNSKDIDLVRSKAKKKIANLTKTAIEDAYSNSSFRSEMSKHINNNFSSKRTGLSGTSLGMNNIQSIVIPLIMKFKDIGKKVASLNQISLNSAEAILIFNTKDDSYTDWLTVGRKLQNTLVFLELNNVGASIFAAPIEIGSHRDVIRNLLKDKRKHPQILVAIGCVDSRNPYSRRAPTDSLLINS